MASDASNIIRADEYFVHTFFLFLSSNQSLILLYAMMLCGIIREIWEQKAEELTRVIFQNAARAGIVPAIGLFGDASFGRPHRSAAAVAPCETTRRSYDGL